MKGKLMTGRLPGIFVPQGMKISLLLVLAAASLAVTGCGRKKDTTVKGAKEPVPTATKTEMQKQPESPSWRKIASQYIKESTELEEKVKDGKLKVTWMETVMASQKPAVTDSIIVVDTESPCNVANVKDIAGVYIGRGFGNDNGNPLPKYIILDDTAREAMNYDGKPLEKYSFFWQQIDMSQTYLCHIYTPQSRADMKFDFTDIENYIKLDNEKMSSSLRRTQDDWRSYTMQKGYWTAGDRYYGGELNRIYYEFADIRTGSFGDETDYIGTLGIIDGRKVLVDTMNHIYIKVE